MSWRARVRAPVGAAVLALVVASVVSPASGATSTWTVLGVGSVNNISGVAASDSGWVIVRDNKTAGQNRIALLGTDDSVTPLVWPGTQPKDLEALDAVPGHPGQYAALASGGTGYLLTIANAIVTVDRQFKVPRGTAIEGFALTAAGATTIAVWATRGATATPAKVFAGTFNPSSGAFAKVVTATVSVPYPTTSLRQVSDLKVIAGRLVIASTSDPGNNGPFASALYDIGAVTLAAAKPKLTLQTPLSLGTYAGHKVEAIACLGTTGLLGSDDENLGGAIRTESFCG